MTIYRSHELDRFYRDYGLRMPSDVVRYDEMLVSQKESKTQPMLSRLFNAANISVLYGRPNIGKTPLQVSLAYALASGSNLDGIHTMCAEPQSCLVVSGEMSGGQWGKYLEWNKRIFPAKGTSAFVEIANYPYHLDTEEGQKHFENLVLRTNANHPGKKAVSVIVFDNLKSLTASGDNASGWKPFFCFLDSLRRKHGWTIIVIHHTNKGKDEASFGTSDIDAKVDNKIYIGRDFRKACAKFHGIEQWLPPENDRKEQGAFSAFVAGKVNEMLDGKYADSVWFYLALEKGRDFRLSDQLPVFMRLLPEDNPPHWDAIDILPHASPWSYRSFREAQKPLLPSSIGNQEPTSEEAAGKTDAPAEPTEDAIVRRPNYHELLASRDRELVIRWLRKAHAEGHTTREKMAEWLGCKRHDIDNLMSNDHYEHITKEDLKG